MTAARWLVGAVAAATMPLLQLVWPDSIPDYTSDDFYGHNN